LIWRDSVSLWSAVVAAAPENYFGRYNLAAALRESGRAVEAEQEERRAVEAQVGIFLRAGELLNSRREYARAAPYFERVLRLMPGLPPAVEGLETARRAPNGR
jgi:tetratricopeptide (TPR) repeat protein